jgi:hypothetical protein
MRHYRGVVIVNPGQFLLALELYRVEGGAMAERFGPEVLKDVLETAPLDPETAGRVEKALALSKGP